MESLFIASYSDQLLTAGPTDNKDDQYNQYNQAIDTGNHASLGHEALAGGAAFAAVKVFEDRQRKEGGSSHGISLLFQYSITDTCTGKPVSHQFAKEMIAGLAGAEVDRFAETTGADWVDKERAKRDAREHAEGYAYSPHLLASLTHLLRMYNERYGGGDQYDPNQSNY